MNEVLSNLIFFDDTVYIWDVSAGKKGRGAGMGTNIEC